MKQSDSWAIRAACENSKPTLYFEISGALLDVFRGGFGYTWDLGHFFHLLDNDKCVHSEYSRNRTSGGLHEAHVYSR